MQRSDFVKLVGFAEGELDSRRRRGQMPYYAAAGERMDFSPFNAFLAVATTDLARSGVSLNGAARCVRDLSVELQQNWEAITKGDAANYFVGYATIEPAIKHSRYPRAEASEIKLHGSITDIAHVLRRVEDSGRRVYRTVLVNAVDAWRKVAERAQDEGIYLAQGS